MADPVTVIVVAAKAATAASELLTALTSLATQLATFVAAVIAAASAVAKFLPPAEEGTPGAKLHALINKVALNSGYAENKPIEPIQE